MKNFVFDNWHLDKIGEIKLQMGIHLLKIKCLSIDMPHSRV